MWQIVPGRVSSVGVSWAVFRHQFSDGCLKFVYQIILNSRKIWYEDGGEKDVISFSTCDVQVMVAENLCQSS